MRILKVFFKSILRSFDNGLLETSGYVAYTSLVSFFPFMILLISIASLFGQTEQVEYLIYQVQILLPHEVTDVVMPIVESLFKSPRASLITFSIVGLLWASVSGLEALRFGLNRAYELVEKRPIYIRYPQNLLAIIIILTNIIVFGMAFVVLPALYHYLPAIGDTFEFVNPMVETLESIDFVGWVDYILFVVIASIIFSAFYYYIPNHKKRLKLIFPGSILAAFLCATFSSLFSYYISNFTSYTAIYNTLADVLVLLLFLQFSLYFFFLGAQFNQELAVYKSPTSD
jgi:membrane protein